MKRLTCMILLLVPLAGCEREQPADATKKPDIEAAAAKKAGQEHETDLGDVEYAIIIQTDLAPESQDAGVKVDKLVNPKNETDLVTLTVPDPPPDELWLVYTVKCLEPFEKTPVVLRVTVVAEAGGEEQEVGAFSTVLGASARKNTVEEKYEVLGALGAPVDSFLVTTRCQALLMPKGTDEAAVDADTATTPSDRVTEAIRGCPVRVNLEASGKAK